LIIRWLKLFDNYIRYNQDLIDHIVAFICPDISVQHVDHGSQVKRGLIYQGNDGLPFFLLVAAYGEEGIKVFDSNQGFGCVITDIQMPKIDGNQVAEYIRRAGVPDTPVIAITGFDNEQINQKLFRASLMKPFKLQALVELIRQFTSDRQMFG